ncbi:phosphoglycerate dehydrogenase [Gluconacetobacter johannae DSM 13595]|uniref:D-2-hydroxyacid dehydrogenase family protein n=1 Tax=Gluconacetobacter johannae TaxID=112140 RepID=A0A7W4P2R0_9PROT|nr:D-2-hydroxyacid dehydrogenase family protein [Gluconacetobacter johannae]MBB2175287.1 D-2-hydroxyacid dehydrogenase family protein [Gluconacetobacter johannae]GBQ80958.1 phosphoglycerate dehydrogenase [Gluconacetobacter johannae DSM 13595]
MKTCVILDDYQDAARHMADWSTLADRVKIVPLHHHIADEQALVAALADAEIIVIMRERTPFPARLFARLPALRLLVTSGTRNAAIDLAAAGAHGVTVCGTGSGAEAPVELTWALILGLARHLVTENAALRQGGPWQSTIGADLYGRRLGLLGLGRIGTRVGMIGRAFGMKITAWSPNLTPERTDAAGVALAASKEELLETSDFVSIHLVLGDSTRGLLGAPELARMPAHACLVNTARAAIVDQAALIAALEGKQIAGAGLDVFDCEPLPADHPFRRLPNVLATPHLGYVTDGNYRTYFTEAVEDIAAWLAGTPVRVLA